ncbi:MAG: STAS domain-containing protein [Haliea sp.]|jgi:anti-anti-sigma factor
MEITVELHGDTKILRPAGRLDFESSKVFQARVLDELSGCAGVFVVDATELSYVSSAGLRAFLVAAREAVRAGGSFSVCCLQPLVAEVFELSGFKQIIPVHDDLAAALKHG